MMTRKYALFALTTTALLTILTACGGTTAPTTTPAAGSQEEAKGGSGAQSEAAKASKIGEAVPVGNVKLTVNSVRYTPGEGDDAAAEGYTYLVVDTTVENTGKEAFTSRATVQFQVMSSEGFAFDKTSIPGLNGNIDGEVAPGAKVTGEIAFQVPKDAKGLQLFYVPDVLKQAEKAAVAIGDVQ